ncbi:NADH-dependent flavin oxidoreductase [Psychrobacillus glaciei]|uniref:NADH-dependent flavin oxidoreductase n=1 Tax=Psychrobacillus glaciei TaxID=2283160 RepID=A0A5J6SQV1_9BACI|nr:NADH-dependent flavin oxidoreductase [Psychrobacillus glaciei]QFF99883.1 NADH-dependent flavin oxidoreductase [Psychrobacillus glaciei]
MNTKYEKIFQSFTFPSGVEVKNRIMIAPMTTYSSQDNGELSEQELAYYKERSGGVGAFITACAYVSLDGKGFPGQFSVDDDIFIPGLNKLAKTIQSNGTKAILQIYHGGRQSPPTLLPDHQPISPSAIAAEREGSPVPREMTEVEIQNTIKAFGEATRRAIEAGFDGVEIHGANTYLLQQFFSPHSNRREDRWGGTLEKRMQFPLAVVDSVKRAVAEHAKTPFIIGYRISPEEGTNPGITLEDTLQFVEKLADQAIDYLHISVMHFWNGSFREKNESHSRIIKIYEKVGSRVPIVGVGSLHTPDEVIGALETGVPLIALGRELLMEPKWIEKVEAGQEDHIRTTLSKNDQKELVIPDLLWERLVNVKGWLPVEE